MEPQASVLFTVFPWSEPFSKLPVVTHWLVIESVQWVETSCFFNGIGSSRKYYCVSPRCEIPNCLF